MLNFTFCGECERKTTTFFFFLNFDTAVFKNSTPEKIADIWRIERDGISAIKFEAVAWLNISSDVFVAVAVAVAVAVDVALAP